MEKTVKGLSVGSVLITSWFATALSGIVLLQAYFYYRSKPKNDLKIFTILVSVSYYPLNKFSFLKACPAFSQIVVLL